MKNYEARKQALEQRIRQEHGFTLRYVEYCKNKIDGAVQELPNFECTIKSNKDDCCWP